MKAKAQTSFYHKAGEIIIKDHKAIEAGTIREELDLFKINLLDIGKFDGHICGCNTAGFLITKKVLGILFPNEIPIRNTVKVTISEYNRDLMDAICFITGIRLNTGKYTNTENEFSVNESLSDTEETTVMVFERKDNGKKVKAVLDKKYLLTRDEAMAIQIIKPKLMKHEATEEEKKRYAEVTSGIVWKEITSMPEGAITYTQLN